MFIAKLPAYSVMCRQYGNSVQLIRLMATLALMRWRAIRRNIVH
jgi:hypothetical protein